MAENNQTKEISPGILLHKQHLPSTQLDIESFYVFKVELQRLCTLEFTADFSGSENVALEGTKVRSGNSSMSPSTARAVMRPSFRPSRQSHSHTGSMWAALANVDANVGANGTLFIALYNDQGRASKMWWAAKKAYVSLPGALRWLVLGPSYVRLWGPTMVRDLLRLRPFASWRAYKANRGMSPHRDVVDWVGGFPFEVAKPEQIFDFYKARGYQLRELRTCAGGHGCNEFVFQRSA